MNRKTVLCGVVAALLSTMAVAATASPSGTIRFNQVGVARFGKTMIEQGSSITAPNGQSVPSVITYTDPAGAPTNYLPIKTIGELIDANVFWDSEKGQVMIGKAPERVTTSVGEIAEDEWATAPVIGTKAGLFTEVAVSTLDSSWQRTSAPYRMKAAFENGLINYEIPGAPGRISYVSVTNNCADAQHVYICRKPSVASSEDYEYFTDVKLMPGETMKRAFLLDESASSLQTTLLMTVTGESSNISNLTIECATYGHNTEYASPGVKVTDNDDP